VRVDGSTSRDAIGINVEDAAAMWLAGAPRVAVQRYVKTTIRGSPPVAVRAELRPRALEWRRLNRKTNSSR
jgi:hypothetical protein